MYDNIIDKLIPGALTSMGFCISVISILWAFSSFILKMKELPDLERSIFLEETRRLVRQLAIYASFFFVSLLLSLFHVFLLNIPTNLTIPVEFRLIGAEAMRIGVFFWASLLIFLLDWAFLLIKVVYRLPKILR